MMKRLVVVTAAAVMALGSVAALADDKTPAAPVDQAKLKAERDAAQAQKANMTPEQKAAAKKARHKKKQKEMSHIEAVGNPAPGPADAAAMKQNYEATKNDPKALQTNAERQKALKTQSSDPPGHYPTPPAAK